MCRPSNIVSGNTKRVSAISILRLYSLNKGVCSKILGSSRKNLICCLSETGEAGNKCFFPPSLSHLILEMVHYGEEITPFGDGMLFKNERERPIRL